MEFILTLVIWGILLTLALWLGGIVLHLAALVLFGGIALIVNGATWVYGKVRGQQNG